MDPDGGDRGQVRHVVRHGLGRGERDEGEEGGAAAEADRPLGPLPVEAPGERRFSGRFGREVERDAPVLVEGAQWSAAGVEGQGGLAVCHAPLAQRVGSGEGGVAAQVDLDRRGEPAQAELAGLARGGHVGRLGDAELEGEGLHPRLVDRLVQ